MPRRVQFATLALVGVAGLSACSQSGERRSEASLLPTPAGGESSAAAALPEPQATPRPARRAFARARGRSLAGVMQAERASTGARLSLVTQTYLPGTERIAFGVVDRAGAFVYGPTAVYIADSPGAAARGPYVAPADTLRVPAAFRERGYDDSLHGIYHAEVPFARAGTYQVLTLTRVQNHTVAAFGRVEAATRSAIPAVGERAPSVATPTTASTHGNVALLTTRRPPEAMHSVSFAAALGRRPIVLLFSTPAFCRSRLCGPVTDVAVYVQHELGRRAVFIHSEIYRDDEPGGPVQPAVRAFGLRSEPWLFTIDRRGRVAARLEGAFGVHEVRQAVEAALR